MTELVAAAHAGSNAALDELLQRFQPLVRRLARRMGGPPDDAQQVLHLALAVAIRRSPPRAALRTGSGSPLPPPSG